MKLFGREIRSNKNNSKTTYSFEDEELAKMLGIQIDGISNESAKEATFYTCLRIMTDSVSKLPLKLHKGTLEGTQKANDHYLYNLLKLRPNPNMSSSTFWKMVEYQRNYYGHSVVAIDYHKRGRQAGRVKQLIPLNMANMKIWVDDVGLLDDDSSIYYVYTNKQGRQFKFKNSEVLHFLGMTSDGIQGMAVKDYLKTLIDNAQASQSYTNSYLRNGLHSKGIVSYVGDLDEGKQQELQARFKRLAGGISNAGSLLPLPIGFDYKPISTSMADAQFTELSELTIKQIASAFGIKMHQLNNLERSTNSNITEQQKQFYIDTLQPILVAYESELTYKLLTSREVEQGYQFKFNVDSILRSDSEERARYLRTLVEGGIMTSNEARGIIDLPQVDGASELMINGSYLTLQDAVKGSNYKNNSTEGGE